MYSTFKDFLNEQRDYTYTAANPAIKATLDYFGVNKVSEISSAKNWAKIRKQSKGETGRYVGFKIQSDGSIEVIGEKGWALIGIDGKPYLNSAGPLFK
jgi:hypothetical protein